MAPHTCGAGPRAAQPPRGAALPSRPPHLGRGSRDSLGDIGDPLGTAIPWPAPALLPPGASVPTPGSPCSICACRALQHKMGSGVTPSPLPPSGYPRMGFSPLKLSPLTTLGLAPCLCCSPSTSWDNATVLRDGTRHLPTQRGLPKLDLANKTFPLRLLGSPAELLLGPGSPRALAESGRGLPSPPAQALTLQKAADEGCSLRQGLLQDGLPLLALVAAKRERRGGVRAFWRG